MFIGKLSKLSGVSRKAIYLYENMGLIPTPVRQGKYRVYAPEVVDLIQIIRCAQSLGFKLGELVDALQGASTHELPGPDVMVQHIERKRLLLQQQLDAVQHKLNQLDALRKHMRDFPLSVWRCEKTT